MKCLVAVVLSLSFVSGNKTAKFWPIGVVRFQNSVCTSSDGYDGTCYTKYECGTAGGVGSGTCANGIGTCCIFQSTCGTTSSYNNTYFVNPGYPSTLTDPTSCSFTIQKCNSGICQVRLDFLNLNLAQPDGNGNCVTDSLIVTGGASTVPVICGENSGQHIYVNFNGASNILLTISIGSSTAPRSWSIKVTQLACDCPSLAPTGCLMYYTDVAGTVNSFNYGTTISGGLITLANGQTRPGTRQLANENYGVCVQMQAGYCSIQWSAGSDITSFTVSGNTALLETTNTLPDLGDSGTDCSTDFVVIPNPYGANGMAINADRFCGNGFPTVTTSTKPFVLTVVTDGNDLTDIANRGFSLEYQQLPCSGVATGALFVG